MWKKCEIGEINHGTRRIKEIVQSELYFEFQIISNRGPKLCW